MKIIEYGKENMEAIILLHGGGLSWWNFRAEAELLKNRFHVLLPVLDGHADSDEDFIDIESNAQEIIRYIDKNFNGNVLLIGGLSLGAQILLEILSQRKDICRYAIVESALVKPSKLTALMISPMLTISYGLVKQAWFSKIQFRSLKLNKAFYEDYYKDTCKITKANMISLLKANSNFRVTPRIKEVSAKVLILVGGKEQPRMKNSAIEINGMFLNSRLAILDGYYHGDLSINHPDIYVRMIDELVKE